MTEVHVAESSVMGRLAVLITSGCLAIAGIFQLSGWSPSPLISDFGGESLDVVWSVVLVTCFLLTLAGRLWPDDAESAMWELTGIAVMVPPLLVYLWALFAMQSPAIVIALTTAPILNALGRALLLARRLWLLRKVVPA